MNSSSLIDRLKRDRIRIGKIRKALIELFELTSEPLSAQDILIKLNTQNITPNKTSIYRELSFLCEQHIIRTVHVSHTITYYESAFLTHHHHLICEVCDQIEDISVEALEKSIQNALDTITKQQQFQIKKHSLEFYGECRKCQQ